jgi:hypothetical protein
VTRLPLLLVALLGPAAWASNPPAIALPTTSSSDTREAKAAAEEAGVAHLIRPTRNPQVLFHWTAPSTAEVMERDGIKVHAPGTTTNGARSGQGFYLSDRIENWTNLDRNYRPLVFVHDGSLRVIGDEWLQAKERFPTLEEAQRYGIDGFESGDELILYNSARIRRLPPTEALPHIRAALAKVKPTWNRGDSIRSLAKEVLTPEEQADFVPRSFVSGVIVSRPLRVLAANPSRTSLEQMIRIALVEDHPHGASALAEALADKQTLPSDEAAVRRAVRRVIAPLSRKVRGSKSHDEALAIYREARETTMRRVDAILAKHPSKAPAQRVGPLARP